MDEGLLQQVGPQDAALILGNGSQSGVRQKAHQQLSRLGGDGLRLHQIGEDGSGTGRIDLRPDGVDDVHHQRLPVHMDTGDADVAAAAPPGFHDVQEIQPSSESHKRFKKS